jgi:hypothetical protein
MARNLDQSLTDRDVPADRDVSGGAKPTAQLANRVEEAVAAAAVLAEETGGLGRPGRPVNRRSPFFVGMAAAAGVAVTYGLVELTIRARSGLPPPGHQLSQQTIRSSTSRRRLTRNSVVGTVWRALTTGAGKTPR